MGTSHLPLNALRAFEAAGRCQSIKRAAEDLFLTPSAVSQQIRSLEARLGVELFLRTNRRLTFTEAGRQLFTPLRESFGQMERAISEVVAGKAARTLKVKLPPTMAIRWFIPRLARLLGQHPELEVEVITTARPDDGSLDDVDFAFRYGLGDWKDVESVRLFGEEWVPVCAPTVARSLSEPADVRHQTLLHSMLRPEAWSVWLRNVGLGAADSNSNQRFSNGALALQAAIDGLGIAVAQRAYLEPDLSSGRLVIPIQATVETQCGYYLVSSTRKSDQPKIRQFRDWLVSVLE